MQFREVSDSRCRCTVRGTATRTTRRLFKRYSVQAVACSRLEPAVSGRIPPKWRQFGYALVPNSTLLQGPALLARATLPFSRLLLRSGYCEPFTSGPWTTAGRARRFGETHGPQPQQSGGARLPPHVWPEFGRSGARRARLVPIVSQFQAAEGAHQDG